MLVAHTGLEDLSSAVDLWRGLPMDSEVRAHAWLVRPEELPCSDEAKERWLYEWWKRIDSWIGAERRSQGRPPR